MNSPQSQVETEDETTGLPALPTWRGVYFLVVAFFTIVVVLLILLERAFA